MTTTEPTKPSLLVPLAAAAVLAAVVSFAVASLAGGSGDAATPAPDPRVAVLEATVESLRAELQTMKTRLDGAATPDAVLETRLTANETTLAALGRTVTTLEVAAAQQGTALSTLTEAVGGVGGRIEANYANVRSLDKRVKTLESR